MSTSGFEQQEPLASRGLSRAEPIPQQVGVREAKKPAPAESAPARRPAEPRSF